MGVGERGPAPTDLLGLLRPGQESADQPALEAHALLHAVLASVTDFVVVCQPDGTILYINRTHPGARPAATLSAYDAVTPSDRLPNSGLSRNHSVGGLENRASS